MCRIHSLYRNLNNRNSRNGWPEPIRGLVSDTTYIAAGRSLILGRFAHHTIRTTEGTIRRIVGSVRPSSRSRHKSVFLLFGIILSMSEEQKITPRSIPSTKSGEKEGLQSPGFCDLPPDVILHILQFAASSSLHPRGIYGIHNVEVYMDEYRLSCVKLYQLRAYEDDNPAVGIYSLFRTYPPIYRMVKSDAVFRRFWESLRNAYLLYIQNFTRMLYKKRRFMMDRAFSEYCRNNRGARKINFCHTHEYESIAESQWEEFAAMCRKQKKLLAERKTAEYPPGFCSCGGFCEPVIV